MEWTLITVVGLALLFDFTNGFHDTANAVATSVSTKAVSPKVAVIGAALLNFIGAFASIKVATTIAKGIVLPEALTLSVILAGIIGAILWNLITWRFGIPTSSSHALIGGVAGASVAAVGYESLISEGLKNKVLLPSLASPIIGFLIAATIMSIILWVIKKRSPEKMNNLFRRLQIVSAGFVAFTHGTNDAQKTMGVITLALLIANPSMGFHVPFWVVASSATAMALGTYLGGWRIIQTLGQKVVKLEPPQGFAAETTTAAILWFTAHNGIPVSTTHTVSGSIVGSGFASNPSLVRWKVIRNIVLAWLITLPSAALIGGAMNVVTRLPGGTSIVFSLAIALVAMIYVTRNWGKESFAQFWGRLALVTKIKKQIPKPKF